MRKLHPMVTPRSARGVNRRYRSAVLPLVLIVACLLLLPACNQKTPTSGGPTEITVWHPWGGDLGKQTQRLVDRYHASQNRVRVRLVFTPTDLSTNQKFFTAIAANKPPDVAFVDGTQDAQWAEWGALTPLDDFVKRDNVRAGDYFPPCWKQALYKGRIWSLTYGADPNFVFCWNKDAFRRAGLDPENPPRTIAELDAMAEKLTTFDGKGRIKTLGIIPWGQYGLANSLFTWGWAFGGSFYDEETQTITASDPRVVKALEWMVSYGNDLGITRINASTSGWGNQANNPFITGQLAMQCVHITTLKEIKRYAPDLDFGITSLPGTPDGEIGSSWVGGWSVALPRGCPHPEEAWHFIHWLCATPEGTTASFEETDTLPGYRVSPVFDKIRNHPEIGEFVKILEAAKHQRPTMPAQAYYMGALDRAVDNALYGRMTPKEALERAEKETQRELDLILGRRVQ
ncbi:MAG TPA: ABC transporter substrate-binding protein [Armatimonadota bacterium]|nr:ABC transporter substrate-binding protein [Armatimonadota bacterium]